MTLIGPLNLSIWIVSINEIKTWNHQTWLQKMKYENKKLENEILKSLRPVK